MRCIYRRIYHSPSPIRFESPWNLSFDLTAIDATCIVNFEQVDYGGKMKIGPGNMDARVKYELLLERVIDGNDLLRETPGDGDTDTSNGHTSRDALEAEVRDEFGPVADIITTLITARIGYVFLQERPDSTVQLIPDAADVGGMGIKLEHGNYTASIGGDLPEKEIAADLSVLQNVFASTMNLDWILKSEFFLGSLLASKPIERFILAFAGLESIIYSVGLDLGSEFISNYEELCVIVETVDDSTVRERLKTYLQGKKGVLINHSLQQRFEALSGYIHGSPNSGDVKDFKRVNRIRNDVLHGRITNIKEVPLFSSKGFAADDPISTVQRLYLKYLYALMYSSAQ